MNIEAIDLFCGAGGLTRGLLDAGVVVKAGFDLDGACEHAYETNNPGAKFYQGDVAKVKATELKKIWSPGATRLLAGCAPCQPFSTAANAARTTVRKGLPKSNEAHRPISRPGGQRVKEDARYDLLDHFARLVWSCRPELVTMENVPRVKNHPPFKRFVERLRLCKYDVWFRTVECTEVGVPQTRRRLVLLASRLGTLEKTLMRPEGESPSTVEEAIGNLPALRAGERDPADPIHVARNLTPTNLARIRASTPGGTWEEWPEELRSACHKKESGQSYKSVYSRMIAACPAPTITTQFYNFGTGRFGHPEQDRPLTPREAAILQSFPVHYEFVRPGDEVFLNVLGRMIGNAVPPKLGEAIGKTMIRHVALSEPRRARDH